MDHNPVTMSHHDGGMMMMQMTFYASCKAQILFEGWETNTCLEMFGSCMAIVVAGIVYEGIKALRSYVERQMRRTDKRKAAGCCSGGGTQGDEVEYLQPVSGFMSLTRKQAVILIYLLQSFLYLVQVGFGYLIMLVAMTFNAWLFISIFCGAGLGYLIFNFPTVKEFIRGADAPPSHEQDGDTHCHL